jgi:drug/metabolite transporter (DMT)-like permease
MAERSPGKTRGVLLVLFASALWGGSGPLTKILKAAGADVLDILSWRYLIGLASLWAFLLICRRERRVALEGRIFRTALPMAIAMLAVSGAFILSNFYTTVANAIALNFTAPIFAAVLAWVFLKERIRPVHQLAAVIGIAGVSVMVLHRSPPTGGASGLSPDPTLGNSLALVSGAVFGGYFVLARKFAAHEAEVVTATLWQFLLLAAILAPVTVFTLFRGISGVSYLYLGVFGVFCTAAPILLINLSALFLKAHEISIVALSEVPFSIFLGMLLVGEYPSPVSWVGIVLIVAAAFLVTLKEG